MNIRINISSKQDSDGCAELLLRVVIGRSNVYRIKSGIRVPANSWNASSEKLTIPRLHTPVQDRLRQLQLRIDNLLTRIVSGVFSMDVESITKEFIEKIVNDENKEHTNILHEKTSDDPFKQVFDSFIRLQVTTNKRAEQYHCLWKQMMRFAVFMKGSFCWQFGITADDILDFEHFLLDEPSFFEERGKPKPQYAYIYEGIEIPSRINRGKNSVASIIKKLRIFFNWAQKKQMYTCPNPFANYHALQPVYGTPFFMTKEEIDQLYTTDFSSNKRLEFHRDLFVFQSNVGMRVGDLFTLTKQNLIDSDTLEYIPSKTITRTGKSISVPLTKVAKTLINKYGDNKRVELFPFDHPNYYNEDIKIMLKTAGIERKVTIYDPLTSKNVQKPICEVASSHMARRNFIGNLYNKVADPNIIGSMTGHVDGSKAFARYRTIGEDLKKKALSALE